MIKIGYIRPECPLLEKERKIKRREKKKAMLAALESNSDSSTSEIEEAISNFCLIEKEVGDEPKENDRYWKYRYRY